VLLTKSVMLALRLEFGGSKKQRTLHNVNLCCVDSKLRDTAHVHRRKWMGREGGSPDFQTPRTPKCVL